MNEPKAILFIPEYMPEDIVVSKLNKDEKYMVVGYELSSVTAKGEIKSYLYRCADDMGIIHFFSDLQIERSLVDA